MSATARLVRYTLVADLHISYSWLLLLLLLFFVVIALPHILVAKDDNAGSEVAKDANDEEQRVKYGER